MKIILSIKPEFVKEIFAGRKKYEYRKTMFTKSIDSVIIYSTMPEGKFVGEFLIDKIEVDTPSALWSKTNQASGISKQYFDQYFNNRKKGYAIKIASIKKYSKPINPHSVIDSFVAPQSFRYLKDEEIDSWKNAIG